MGMDAKRSLLNSEVGRHAENLADVSFFPADSDTALIVQSSRFPSATLSRRGSFFWTQVRVELRT